MRWTTDRIRQSFLDFFKERGHLIVPSAPLIPHGDPTLLFVNAGMVPFKDYFLGIRSAPAPRVVDCQKCLRISGKHNDLEAVGRDTYHHTFFEMLGNWSFGDYYKRDAIDWHWKLITKVWGVDPALLYATVHKDDDEAEKVWRDLKVLPDDRILKFGDKDNFWEMGETGPCGPNSEIDIDRGPAACDGSAHPGQKCFVNVDGCSRFVELGNLVFIQYNRDATGKLTALPKKHVDTGTGLERVAAVLQGLESGRVLGNYDIDLFRSIITGIERAVAGVSARAARYGIRPEWDVSFRAIADHSRAIAFLIAEGVRPGNSDREYVLRRLMRRAVRHGHKLGVGVEGGALSAFLRQACRGVVGAMGGAYPELTENESEIGSVCSEEALRFEQTLGRGLELLAEWRERQRTIKSRRFPGDIAFQLHDTYGFPLDLTQDILRDDGMEVDVAEFDRLMTEQRERGRSARKDDGAPEIALGAGSKSQFVGYRRYQGESQVVAAEADSERGALVTAETVFYPEGGGQTGDRGVIEAESGALFEVTDTRKHDGAIIHLGRLLRGDLREFARGTRVTLKVDRVRRDAAMLNHSATHILHYALRDILGTHVQQKGSMVAPERLRFDFSHTGPIVEGDLATIEEEINARIRENAAVTTEEMAYNDAIKAGALAFFGDKYGDRVRVVRMGDFSVELCGGTHVARTGDIGVFKLDAESGVAAGVRRIEAFTGSGALEAVREREKLLGKIAAQLGTSGGAALDRLERLLAREKELEKKLRAMEQKLVSGAAAGGNAEEVREAAGIKIVTRRLEGVEPRTLREIADRLRQKYESAVVALGSDLGEGKAALLVAVTSDLTARVKAGEIIRQIAPIVGGSGGGRPDMAQAGGRDATRLDEALRRVAELVA